MEALKQLILVMEKMLDTNRQLLSLAQDKRKWLIDNDIQELQKLTHRELVCVDGLQKLESKRILLVKECMSTFEVSSDSFSFEELLGLLDNKLHSYKPKLIEIAKQLREVITKVNEINENNQQLIQTSLSYLDYSMGILVPKEPSIGYGPKAEKRYSSLLDAKI